MNQWINFAEIRAQVSLEDVLFRFYRLTTLKRDGDKIVGPCPVHNGDSPRAFSAHLSKNVWHCFSKCKKGGNQLDFVAAKEGISVREAALKLQAFFLSGVGTASTAAPSSAPQAHQGNGRDRAAPAGPTPPTTKPAADENPPLPVKLDLKADHPHLLQGRGLKLETLQHFGVGYCSRGILRGMIAIPIHDEENELVAYAGRRLKPSDIREFGKYKLPKGFRKELVLYNLNRANDYLDTGILLVEGFFTVLKLYEAGFPNVVAAMGSDLSDPQARLLADAAAVVIVFDGNEAGTAGANAAAEKLRRFTTVRIIRLPENLEPEQLSPKALRWLLNGVQALDLAEVSFSFHAGRGNGHDP